MCMPGSGVRNRCGVWGALPVSLMPAAETHWSGDFQIVQVVSHGVARCLRRSELAGAIRGHISNAPTVSASDFPVL